MNIFSSMNKIFGACLRSILYGIERFFAKGLLLFRIFSIIIVFFTGCCTNYCLKYRLLLLKKLRGSDYAKVSIVLMLSNFAKIQVRV